MTAGATTASVRSTATAGDRSFLAVGEFRPNAHQPLWFSEPLLLFDTDGVGIAPHYRPWLSMYSSLTEREGERILWYSDRKLFGLGRYITDEMLAPLTVPED